MRQMILVALMIATAGLSLFPQEASAGPLLDWWRNRPRLLGRNNVAAPVTAFSPGVASFQTGCTQTCQRVSVNYVPETNYRSLWVQTPVTSYRPSTTADPCTGCQVTCMKPCTTYQWTLRRVPYTTYRPVYQTQTVQMPVASPSGCSTCSVGSMAGQASPYSSVPVSGYSAASPYPTDSYAVTPTSPSSGYPTNPGNGYGNGYPATNYGGQPSSQYQPSGSPADMQPSLSGSELNSSQRIPTVYYDQYGNPIQPPQSPTDRSIMQRVSPDGQGVEAGGNQGSGSENAGDPTSTSARMPMRINSLQYGSGVINPTQPINNQPSNNHSPIADPNPGMRQMSPRQAPPIPRAADLQAVQLHRPWDYNPVRLASYETPTNNQPQQYSQPQIAPQQRKQTPVYRQPQRRMQNEGWETMNR